MAETRGRIPKPPMRSQHPSPTVKNPLQVRAANLARRFSHHVMPKVLVLKAQGHHVMCFLKAFFWPKINRVTIGPLFYVALHPILYDLMCLSILHPA